MPTDYNQLIKSNFVKLVVLMLLSMVMGIVSFGLLTDKHINLWLVEFNGDKKESKADTIYTQLPPRVDTVFKEKEVVGLGNKSTPKPAVGKLYLDKEPAVTKKETAGVPGKNINTGTNNGIIGDNATMGAVQPKFGASLMGDLEAQIPSKTTKVRFMYSSSSIFSKKATDDLINMFIERGYENVHYIVDFSNHVKAPPLQVIRMTKPQEKDAVQFFVNAEQ